MYFNQVVKGPVAESLRKNFFFWICTGLLVFYLLTFPLFGLFKYLAVNYPESILPVYFRIMLVLDCFMYLIFAYAFLWTKPK